MYSYLDRRYHRIKIGSHRSTAKGTKIDIPQESVLGPLLFNIFIYDLLLMKLNSEIWNFADDNTIYLCAKGFSEIVTHLKIDLGRLLEWVAKNGMIANPKKFQLMFL